LVDNIPRPQVGIVKQVRLKVQAEARQGRAQLGSRRKSAQVRVRGIIGKILGQEKKSKSCENLNVI
jgi:hypothetical protein